MGQFTPDPLCFNASAHKCQAVSAGTQYAAGAGLEGGVPPEGAAEVQLVRRTTWRIKVMGDSASLARV